MKKVIILGATGTFGTALTAKLLQETDCKLTLFARHIQDKMQNSERVNVISGDATNKAALQTALQGQDIVYCAISGEQLPEVAQNLVELLPVYDIQRLLFMGAVGIYNEIPVELDDEDNVRNNPEQVPNRRAVDIVETSTLAYTVLRPGYLQAGAEDDFVLTFKGEQAKGYISTLASVVKFAVRLINDDNLYVRKRVSITKNMV